MTTGLARTFALATLSGLALCAGSEALAQRVTYTLRPDHTFPSFEASHYGLSIWRGRFRKSSGSVVLDRAAQTGSVTVNIDARSVDFGVETMDESARGDKMFNVEKFPQITYRGQFVKFRNGLPTAVEGELTLLGVTRKVPLTFNSFVCTIHPALKRETCGVDAVATFNRKDFGMDFGLTYTPAAGEVLGDTKVLIQAEAWLDQ